MDKGCFRVRRATKDGPPALSTILAAAAEIAAAMAYLHGRGVVHGDLAGGNVLLCSAPDAPHGFSCKVLLPLHISSWQCPSRNLLYITSWPAATCCCAARPTPPTASAARCAWQF